MGVASVVVEMMACHIRDMELWEDHATYVVSFGGKEVRNRERYGYFKILMTVCLISSDRLYKQLSPERQSYVRQLLKREILLYLSDVPKDDILVS